MSAKTDARVAANGENSRISNIAKFPNGNPNNPLNQKYWTEERRNSHSRSCVGKCGGPRKGAGRGVKSTYMKADGTFVSCDSSYEKEVCELLELLNVKYEKSNNYKFYFHDKNGNKRAYFPDFYLPDFDLFVEVKRWMQ